MRIVTRSLLLFALVCLVACATTQTADTAQTVDTEAVAARGNCDNVRCASCPEGQTPSLKPPNCCECVPVDTKIKDCSAVRCASCPEGFTPSLKPPDCCKCVPIK